MSDFPSPSSFPLRWGGTRPTGPSPSGTAQGDPVYFVAETSGKAPQPQGVEAAKLQCARAHFAAVSGGEVMCGAVRDLDELLRIVG